MGQLGLQGTCRHHEALGDVEDTQVNAFFKDSLQPVPIPIMKLHCGKTYTIIH